MAALKLFISHSSNLDETDEQARPLAKNWNLLRETCAAVRAHYEDKVEILVDYEGLIPAMDWRGRLRGWLGECDVAVILLSRRALDDSQWVKFEASVLQWRSDLDPAFRLLPVLLEGESDPVDLEQNFWATIDIANTQCVRSAAGAAQILAGIRAVLGELEHPDSGTAFGARFHAIRTLIKDCSPSTGTDHAKSLESVWQSVAGGKAPPTWPVDAVGRYALGLTQLLVEDTKTSVQTFKRIVEHMHPPFQHPLRLFTYVRPLWVDAVAADCLKTLRSGSLLLALNGELVTRDDDSLDTKCYTLDRYLERALLRRGSIKIVQVPSADADAILNEIRTSVDKQWNKYPNLIPLVDKRVRTLDSPVIALIPAANGLPDPRLVDDLKRLRDEACPKLVFVFATGASVPAELPQGVQPVLPELDPESEYWHYLDECDVRAALPDA